MPNRQSCIDWNQNGRDHPILQTARRPVLEFTSRAFQLRVDSLLLYLKTTRHHCVPQKESNWRFLRFRPSKWEWFQEVHLLESICSGGSATRWSINSGVSTTSPVDQLFSPNPRIRIGSLPTADLVRQPQQSKGPTEPPCRRPSSHYSDYLLYSREIFKHAPKLKSFDPNKNSNDNNVYSDDRFTIRRKTFPDQYGSLDRSRDSSRGMTAAPRDRPTVGFVDRSLSIDLSAENRFRRNVWDRRSLQEDQSSAWPYFRTQRSFVDDTPGSGSSRGSMQSLEGIDDDDREGYQSDDYEAKRRTNLEASTELSTPEVAIQYRKSPRGPGSRSAAPQEVALQCGPSSGSPGNRPAKLEIVAHSRDKRLSGESLRRSMLESIMQEKMKNCQISPVSDSSKTFDRIVQTVDRKNVDGSPPDVGSNPTLRRLSVDDQSSDTELFKNSSLTSEISPSGEYLSSPDGAKPKKYVSSLNIFLGSIKWRKLFFIIYFGRTFGSEFCVMLIMMYNICIGKEHICVDCNHTVT